MLKSKLHKVVVTEANIEYDGSITIDEDLMDAAMLYEYEYVEVNGSSADARINTYVLKGERGSGCIKMNGGAARHFKVGDEVHVLSFGLGSPSVEEIKKYKPITVLTDKNNKII